jgi:hypothetical protein
MDRITMRQRIDHGSRLQTKSGKHFRVRASDEGLEFEVSTGKRRTVGWERGDATLDAVYQEWLAAGKPDSTTWFGDKPIGSRNGAYLLATFKHLAAARTARTVALAASTPSEQRLELSWTSTPAGPIGVDAEGALAFPAEPSLPGVYVLRFADGRSYVGEVDDLRRRFQNYRAPGPAQPLIVRLNQELLAAQAAGVATTVELITEAQVRGAPLDLSQKANRVLVEHAALWLEAQQGRQLVE